MSNDKSARAPFSRPELRPNCGSLRLRIEFFLVSLFASILDRKAKRRLKGGRYAILKHLPKHLSGVEIGVWKGEFSVALNHFLAPRELTLVDPWILPDSGKIVFPRAKSGQAIGVENHAIEKQTDADQVFEYVKNRFASFKHIRVWRSTSVEAARRFEENTLDWIYVDGSHYYEDVRDDLGAWLPKIKNEGYIVGDDYYWKNPAGEYSVKRAVDEFVAQHQFKNWVVFRGQFLIQVH